MKAMILAAGAATGLYPLTYTLPQALVPVMNRPSIEHLIDWLAAHKVDDVVINLHYLHSSVTQALSERVKSGTPRLHLTVESELSGTAGGLALAQDHFDDTFVVASADLFTNLNLSKMLDFHREKRALCTIAGVRYKGVRSFGLMEVNDNGRVIRFCEKPPLADEKLGWVNTGIYIMEPDIFSRIPDVRPFDFGEHLFPTMVGKRGGVFCYQVPDDTYWNDIDDPLAYRDTHRVALTKLAPLKGMGEEIQPQVFTGKDCHISPEAIIIPPVQFDDGVIIRKGARIEGPVVLGKDVVVGEDAKVADSVVWRGTVIGKGAKVSASLIGSSCHLNKHLTYEGVLLASGARFERKGISSD
ncbi:MAG TPA: NDP-sugar synthase [Phycisphaerales bacterium]|nr:NDP-sugar synthase [Phycisphaerales bacterium]